MNVHRLFLEDIESARRWDEFVLSRPDANFFQRSGWQKVIKTIFHHECYYLFCESEGRITGILPLAHVKSLLFGRSLVSLPFAVYGGIAAVDQANATRLEQEAMKLAVQLGVDYLEFRNLSPKHEDWPVQDLYFTFRKEISCDPAINLLAIPRKQRAMVRKGINNGLISTLNRDVDGFYLLYSDNVHRHGTPALPKRYFKLLLDVFGEDCNILTVTSAEGDLLSAVMSFYFRSEILPYYAGDQFHARIFAANDFKYWELMRRAADRGCTIFDFGRSKRHTGSFSFKKNWGFEPAALHYEYCLYRRNKIPQNNPANPNFRLLVEVWKRLPISLANRVGPYVVSSLG